MKNRHFFGTDGIRGCTNQGAMTPQQLLKIAGGIGHYFQSTNGCHRVVIGKDTRLSCYMIENILAAGLMSVGMDIQFLGPIPTPAVPYLTKSMRADLGIMISASHNPFQDNGIKLFGRDGLKLSDDIELEIEQHINNFEEKHHLAAPVSIGRANRIDDAIGRYIEYLKSLLPSASLLSGLKIVVDAANGAAYRVAPQILWELGADVISIASNPNGTNINNDCGALHLNNLRSEVIAQNADIGIALDGDADRVMLVSPSGRVIHGDDMLALLATFYKEKNRLGKPIVVGTILTNLGFENYLKSQNIDLLRTNVGDRYIIEKMFNDDIMLGGEPSGHVIINPLSTTGDGLLVALQLLSILSDMGKSLDDIFPLYEEVPQHTANINTDKTHIIKEPSFQQALSDIDDKIKGKGRVIVRPSGTEPLIRIMVESHDHELAKTVLDDVQYHLEKKLAEIK